LDEIGIRLRNIFEIGIKGQRDMVADFAKVGKMLKKFRIDANITQEEMA